MTKTKKIHPADQADRDAVLTAASFNVHLRRSPTSKVNHPASSLVDAIDAYDAMRREDENRRPIIYAITPAGVSIPVPQDMIVAHRRPMPDATTRPDQHSEKEKPEGKRAVVMIAAMRGQMPTPPDFSAETHKRFRKKLAELVALADAGDIDGLKAFHINPISSSPKAMDKFRNLAIIALEARKAGKIAA